MRIAIIGHMIVTPNNLDVPSNSLKAKTMVGGYNYTRVVTGDNQLVDHLAYLKELRQVPKDEPFTVWEMWLCGSLLLGSHLKRNGFDVKLVNYIDTDNLDTEMEGLRAFKPDILVVSSTFILTKTHLFNIGRVLREKLPDAFVVAGGHHIYTTLLYMKEDEKKEYLEGARMDAFVEDSQGEGTLLDICRAFPGGLGDVPNLVWRDRDGGVHVNERRAEANDINATPMDLSLLKPSPAAIHIRTARSCSFNCAFCSYPAIAGDLSMMEIDVVVNTLRQAMETGISTLFFADDTFNVPKNRFEALIDRMIAEKIELPWYSFLRCQYLDEGLVTKMKRTGCSGVFLGVESGSDKILKAMKKGAVSRFYWDGIQWLKDHDIATVGSFVMGFPTETAETVAETKDFINESGLDFYFIQPFYYLHHTPVHKNAERYGLTGNGLYWSHDTMNWRQAIEHINQLFLSIDRSIFVNPDYTLWEIAYLRFKNLSMPEIRAYRKRINQMTADQMHRFGLTKAKSSDRPAV